MRRFPTKLALKAFRDAFQSGLLTVRGGPTKLQTEFRASSARSDPAVMAQAADSLGRGGAIVLRGFYARADVDPLRASVEDFFEQAERWRNVAPETVADDRFHLQNGLSEKPGDYGASVKSKKPVVNFRNDEDVGLIDVFHPERLFPAQPHGMSMVDEAKERFINELIGKALGARFKTRVRNLYANYSVESTRHYHTDGLALKAKAFVYLTDVETVADGPYCYALGTHLAPSSLVDLNNYYNHQVGRRKDDFLIHDVRARKKFLGERGDLIVSLQYGAHRGLPQAKGHRRLVLVHTAVKG